MGYFNTREKLSEVKIFIFNEIDLEKHYLVFGVRFSTLGKLLQFLFCCIQSAAYKERHLWVESWIEMEVGEIFNQKFYEKRLLITAKSNFYSINITKLCFDILLLIGI